MEHKAISKFLAWEQRQKDAIETQKSVLATELLDAVPTSLRGMVTPATIEMLLIIGREGVDFHDTSLGKTGIANRDQLKIEIGKLRAAWARVVEVAVMEQDKSLRVNFLAI